MKKLLPGAMIVTFHLVTACNNLFHSLPRFENFFYPDNIPIEEPEPAKPVLPEIIKTDTTSGAIDVELNKTIIVSFSKDMDTSSINNTTFIIETIENKRK